MSIDKIEMRRDVNSHTASTNRKGQMINCRYEIVIEGDAPGVKAKW